MRGKVIDFDHVIAEDRITPAYAGKSEIFELSHNLKKDHPRLCGEKPCPLHKHCGSGGSPPPMRGKASVRCYRRYAYRITPAYAGKRLTKIFQVAISGDHPRLCGEKRLFSVLLAYHKGSPPPMRGKGDADGVTVFACRITPAYAGKSSENSERVGSEWDHPRLCGEKIVRPE